MTNEEQEEWDRGYRHGDIPRRPEARASEAYMAGYLAALRGPEEPRQLTFQERFEEYKRRK